MEDEKYHYKVTEDGTVVLDQNDEIVVQCPTEQEAVEYIKEHGRSRDKVSLFCLKGDKDGVG